MKIKKHFKLLIVLMFLGQTAQAAELTVEINNIKNNKGEIILQLFTLNEDNNLDSPTLIKKIPAPDKKSVLFTINELEPGKYAVISFKDLNGNGKADFSLFGNKEPAVISNFPSPPFSKPSFTDAAFDLDTQDKKMSLAFY
jgi:uncharacterized protein (DUF2141 family)